MPRFAKAANNNGSIKLGGGSPYTDTYYYDVCAIADGADLGTDRVGLSRGEHRGAGCQSDSVDGAARFSGAAFCQVVAAGGGRVCERDPPDIGREVSQAGAARALSRLP